MAKKEERKDFVRIQSTKTITVTPGLQCEDVTNVDAHVADRLKINPLWPRCNVMIEAGQHLYPSEIVDWPTVKALQKDGILTIGEYVDSVDDITLTDKKNDVKQALEEMNKDKKSLNEISEE